MPNYTENENLYKWSVNDTKQMTITEMASNVEKIDFKFQEHATQLAENAKKVSNMQITSIMEYGAYKDGTHPDETTQALKTAGRSGKIVLFPEGTYAVNDTIVLHQFTEFVTGGLAKIKLLADKDLFWITADNRVSGFKLDLYSLDTYTSNIFEISSKTRSQLSSFNNGGSYTCIVEKLDIWLSNNNTSGINGTVFHIWAKMKDENGNAYPTFATAFFNLKFKEIYVHGAIGYFMRDYTWSETPYKTPADVTAWVTGLILDDISLFGSIVYGIFDGASEATMTDEKYRGLSPMWISRMRHQYGARTKKMAFLTDGTRFFKDSIPWDWPGSSVSLLYRTEATYVIENRPYVHMDAGFGGKYYFFDVVSPTTLSASQKNEWIDSRITNYRDASKPMDVLTEPLRMKDSPFIIKKSGYKSWLLNRTNNNNLIIAPSATVDKEDWDYSKQMVINGDTGNVSATSFSESGVLLTNKYGFVDVPATATSPGTVGQMAASTSYLYICVQPNIWKRVGIAGW